MTTERSFRKFAARLELIGLRGQIERRTLALHVSLRDLYEVQGTSSATARRAVYQWLMKEGKSINEIARLFDRAPSGVWKLLTRERGETR